MLDLNLSLEYIYSKEGAWCKPTSYRVRLAQLRGWSKTRFESWRALQYSNKYSDIVFGYREDNECPSVHGLDSSVS